MGLGALRRLGLVRPFTLRTCEPSSLAIGHPIRLLRTRDPTTVSIDPEKPERLIAPRLQESGWRQIRTARTLKARIPNPQEAVTFPEDERRDAAPAGIQLPDDVPDILSGGVLNRAPRLLPARLKFEHVPLEAQVSSLHRMLR